MYNTEIQFWSFFNLNILKSNFPLCFYFTFRDIQSNIFFASLLYSNLDLLCC